MEYVIIGIVLLIILLAVLKASKKDASIDLNKLVEYLVEIDNQLKIILGPDSKQLKKYIDELK